MTKRIQWVVLGLLMMVPSTAMAGPITAGVWSPVDPQAGDPDVQISRFGTGDLFPFWSGASWDGADKGSSSLSRKTTAPRARSSTCTLNTGGFTSFLFHDLSLDITKFNGITGWSNGVFGRRADGAFTYDSGTDHMSNSMDNPEQYALFRVVLPEVTHYFMGIEDILIKSGWANDRDYNDYVVKWERADAVGSRARNASPARFRHRRARRPPQGRGAQSPRRSGDSLVASAPSNVA